MWTNQNIITFFPSAHHIWAFVLDSTFNRGQSKIKEGDMGQLSDHQIKYSPLNVIWIPEKLFLFFQALYDRQTPYKDLFCCILA